MVSIEKTELDQANMLMEYIQKQGYMFALKWTKIGETIRGSLSLGEYDAFFYILECNCKRCRRRKPVPLSDEITAQLMDERINMAVTTILLEQNRTV